MWDYSNQTEPTPYGDTKSYELAARWLKDCRTVEDWGCGTAYARRYFEGQNYVGIDEAPGFADVVADVQNVRRPHVDGILLRHVLEHHGYPGWKDILDNALRTSSKTAVVVFTPFNDVETHPISWNDREGVPDISFCHADLTLSFILAGKPWKFEHFTSNTQYGSERLFYVG